MSSPLGRAPLIEALEARQLLAAALFADLDPGGVQPDNFYPFGDHHSVFSGFTNDKQPALFVSDGTGKGTKLIARPRLSSDRSSVPQYTTSKFVYFTAQDGDSFGLYRNGGSEKSTTLLVAAA